MKTATGVLAGLGLVLAAAVLVQPGLVVGTPGEYNRTTVTLHDTNGTELATVDVRIADTSAKRYTGLSETDSLATGDGMLFVHPNEGSYGYVMRNMSFPLDIVFVDANGTITTIHHAPVEPNKSGQALTRHEGRGKYILEVPYGYTNETGVDVGDTVTVPDNVTAR